MALSGSAENQYQCREAALGNVSLWMSWPRPPTPGLSDPSSLGGPAPWGVRVGLGADRPRAVCPLLQLTMPSPMPEYLNVHYICESASRLLFLSMHWARSIPAFQALG